MYELIGRFGSTAGKFMEELNVCERELLRHALLLNGPIRPAGESTKRHHTYKLEQKAYDYLI